MATAIEGLFNVPTDEAIRQAYLKQQQVSPDVLAQLDAGRQGIALGRMGGAALGGAVGGLLGRRYPEEIRAEQMRKAMSGVTGNTQSERMLSLAQQLQNIPGMEGQAAMAAQKAAEFKAEEDKARVDAIKANAEISKKYEPTKVGVNSQGQVVYSVPNQRGGYSEVVQNVDETGMPGYVANTLPIVGESSLGGTQKRTKVDFKTYNGQVYKIITDANTGETISEEPLGAATSTAPQVNIDMGDKGMAQYGKDLGGRLAERDFNIVEAANQAAPSLEKINQTLDVLEYGDVSTGLGADFMTDVNRFRSQFLNDKKAGKRVSDTQLLEALLGSEVFPLITQLGIGARGLDTPAERDFLRSVFTGTKEMDRDSLIKLTKLREKVAKKAINRYNNMLKAGKFKNYEQVQGYPLEPLAYPERSAPPKPVNPSGKKSISLSGNIKDVSTEELKKAAGVTNE